MLFKDFTAIFAASLMLLNSLALNIQPVNAAVSNYARINEQDSKFALLIGIDKYTNGITPLKGAVADALAMKKLLVNPKFGFSDDENHVRVLTDEQATGKNIMSAFRTHLIANAKAYKEKTGREATIFFHFSGHGSQVKIPQGGADKTDEPDGYDETIVPVDSSRNAGDKNANFDIRDDEIFALVSELSNYTSNVVYVFDSCNSGTVNRGGDVAREVPVDKREQPAYQLGKFAQSGGKDRNYDDFLLGSDKYVFIAGTQSRHKSYEINEGGVARGALSFYLERALREASPQTTYAELMRRVGAEVNHHNSDQEPQLAGDKRRLVLGGNFQGGDIPIPVIAVDEQTALVTIGAGKMLGLRNGSLVAIHNKDNIKIADAIITKTENQSALASYTLLGANKIDKNATAKLLSPLFGAEPVNIQLELSESGTAPKSRQVHNAVLRQIANNIELTTKNVFSVELLEPGQKPKSSDKGLNVSTLAVRRAGFRQAFCGGIDARALASAQFNERCRLLLPEPTLAADEKTKLPLPKDEEEVFFIAPTASGEPLFGFYVRAEDPDAAKNITDALLKYSRQKNLLALENRGGKIAENIKIEFLEVTGHFDNDGFFVTEKETPFDVQAGAQISRSPNVFYRLKFTNQSTKTLFITVLGISNNGSINAMFPQESQQEIKPGNSQTTGLYMTESPYGTERIKFIITKDFSDYSPLAQNSVIGTRQGQTQSNPLTQLMDQALLAKRSTKVPTAPKTDDWGVATIALEIVPN